MGLVIPDVAVLALALATALHGAALDEETIEGVSASVDAILEMQSGGEAAAEALAQLGEIALPVLFECLATRTRPGGGALGSEGERSVLDAFARTPSSACRAFLQQALAASEREITQSGTILRILTETGSSEDLTLAIDAAVVERNGVFETLGPALADATESILRRDERAWFHLSSQIRSAELNAAAALVRGAGRVGGARALEMIGDLLDLATELDLVLLSQVVVAAQGNAEPIPVELLARTRSYLWSDDMQVVRSATLASGELEDHDAVGDLIRLLEHDVPAVRTSAAWALTRITGLRLGEDPSRWAAWFEEESRWFEARAEGLFADLRHGDTILIRAALHELGTHRFQAPRVAGEVVATLRHPDGRVRATACSVLGRLGVRSTAPALVDLLEGDEAGTARAALETLTGWKLPADREAWDEALALQAAR